MLIWQQLTLTSGSALACHFSATPALAYKLLFDASVMDSNNTNFSELAMPDLRSSRLSQTRTEAPPRVRESLCRPRAEQRRPAVGTLMRTRNLILAALRVWELKQGIRKLRP